MATVSFHSAAIAEYDVAFAWYAARSLRAAIGFEAAVERAVQFLEVFPVACPACDDLHRYCALRRYPYGLVYSCEGDRVRVVAVAHNRQLPGHWVGRADS